MSLVLQIGIMFSMILIVVGIIINIVHNNSNVKLVYNSLCVFGIVLFFALGFVIPVHTKYTKITPSILKSKFNVYVEYDNHTFKFDKHEDYTQIDSTKTFILTQKFNMYNHEIKVERAINYK